MTTKNKQFRRLSSFISIVGIIGLLVLCLFVYKQVTKDVAVTTPTTFDTVSTSPDILQEASEETVIPAKAVDTYTVAADEPRILKIDALGIAARVKPMATNSAGAIAAPVNIYDSGWYTGSAKPGAIGAVFIDGHASGATRKGLFAYLDTLKNGNEASIERGDGQVLKYKVVKVETVSKDAVDMNALLRTYDGAREGLNLLTCTGTWINDERTYDKRVVVYTERVL